MTSPKQAAQYCLDTYNTPANFDRWIEVGGVVGGIKGDIIAMRGSQVLEDFIQDIEGIEPMHVDGVGTVGTGFYTGIESFYAQLGIKAGDSITLTGHSLGCCHAAYLARLAIMCGVKVEQLILFAPPRPGYLDFHAGLSAIESIEAFHNTEEIIGDWRPRLIGPDADRDLGRRRFGLAATGRNHDADRHNPGANEGVGESNAVKDGVHNKSGASKVIPIAGYAHWAISFQTQRSVRRRLPFLPRASISFAPGLRMTLGHRNTASPSACCRPRETPFTKSSTAEALD